MTKLALRACLCLVGAAGCLAAQESEQHASPHPIVLKRDLQTQRPLRVGIQFGVGFGPDGGDDLFELRLRVNSIDTILAVSEDEVVELRRQYLEFQRDQLVGGKLFNSTAEYLNGTDVVFRKTAEGVEVEVRGGTLDDYQRLLARTHFEYFVLPYPGRAVSLGESWTAEVDNFLGPEIVHLAWTENLVLTLASIEEREGRQIARIQGVCDLGLRASRLTGLPRPMSGPADAEWLHDMTEGRPVSFDLKGRLKDTDSTEDPGGAGANVTIRMEWTPTEKEE
ncbi:MAG: hypothetical protein HY720_04460 [Planctomycetes bacterium]|nr:hypothetical protein [Planctomycetota bacterium]